MAQCAVVARLSWLRSARRVIHRSSALFILPSTSVLLLALRRSSVAMTQNGRSLLVNVSQLTVQSGDIRSRPFSAARGVVVDLCEPVDATDAPEQQTSGNTLTGKTLRRDIAA